MTFVAGQNNYTIVPPKRENYTFLGYFSRPDGTGTRYFDRLGAPNDEEYQKAIEELVERDKEIDSKMVSESKENK